MRHTCGSYQATGPCQIWTWDITWMPGPIAGSFFYLYLILDIFSRKIVGWEVHDVERAELAAGVIQRAVWAEACIARPKVLHAGEERQMLAKRADLYANARASNPQRWSGKARNWQPMGPVWLNPERDSLADEIRDAA